MKKFKILLCVVLFGLSVTSYLIATHKSAATELLLMNVEALGQDETKLPECEPALGYCIKDLHVYVGMRFYE